MPGRRVAIAGTEGRRTELLYTSGPDSHEVSGRGVANNDIGTYSFQPAYRHPGHPDSDVRYHFDDQI